MGKAARRRIGLTTAILVLSVGLAAPAHSQQASKREPSPGQSRAAKKPAKPPAGKPVSTRSSDLRAPQSRQWTIDDALPSRTRRSEPNVSTPEIGRVPVQGGTFGFSTDQQVDPYKTPDGSRIRGLHRGSESEPSYLGLSLSVRTEDKSFLPPSILPNW